jgi:hypothetical protein
MSNVHNWTEYTTDFINKNIDKKYINNYSKTFIINKVELYIEYCKINKQKIRRERIKLILDYEVYKFSGYLDKNAPKNNHKRIAKFLNIFFNDEKHIYREFLRQIRLNKKEASK